MSYPRTGHIPRPYTVHKAPRPTVFRARVIAVWQLVSSYFFGVHTANCHILSSVVDPVVAHRHGIGLSLLDGVGCINPVRYAIITSSHHNHIIITTDREIEIEIEIDRERCDSIEGINLKRESPLGNCTLT